MPPIGLALRLSSLVGLDDARAAGDRARASGGVSNELATGDTPTGPEGGLGHLIRSI